MSKRTQPLQIVVSSVSFEEEDYRDFAQLLSYFRRGRPRQQRIYDFPAEQHGTDAAMHTQIVLIEDITLVMLRARRPNPLFYESDE